MRPLTTGNRGTTVAYQGQERVAQTLVATPGLKRYSTNKSIKMELHEHWEQDVEDTWVGNLESLQRCIYELLIKNQELRMALIRERRGELP